MPGSCGIRFSGTGTLLPYSFRTVISAPVSESGSSYGTCRLIWVDETYKRGAAMLAMRTTVWFPGIWTGRGEPGGAAIVCVERLLPNTEINDPRATAGVVDDIFRNVAVFTMPDGSTDGASGCVRPTVLNTSVTTPHWQAVLIAWR